jgi:hypothetical protein
MYLVSILLFAKFWLGTLVLAGVNNNFYTLSLINLISNAYASNKLEIFFTFIDLCYVHSFY